MAADQPPDVSHLSRTERLEVLRAYRLQKETKKKFDFSVGPPDPTALAELEGEERLAILREYRQYVQSRDLEAITMMTKGTALAPAGVNRVRRDDAPTPRQTPAPTSAFPWEQDPLPSPGLVDVSDDAGPPPAGGVSAGVASGAHGNLHTYFERPRTTRDESRVAPTAESAESGVEPTHAATLAAQRAELEAVGRAEALEGAAGRQSVASTTAWQGSWLEAETPRNCRRLLPKDNALEQTTCRIFAPDRAPDDAGAEATKLRANELLVFRQ